MLHRIVLLALVLVVSSLAVAYSSEESERAEQELSVRLFKVITDAGWSFAKSEVGETANGTKRTNYFYADQTRRRLLTISIIAQGHMPTNGPEVVEYLQRFKDLGYAVKGWRFIPAKRNTFIVEEQTKVFNGVTTVNTLVLIQGDGAIYNVSGTIVGEESDVAERMKIIGQVSFDGVALSEGFLRGPKE